MVKMRLIEALSKLLQVWAEVRPRPLEVFLRGLVEVRKVTPVVYYPQKNLGNIGENYNISASLTKKKEDLRYVA